MHCAFVYTESVQHSAECVPYMHVLLCVQDHAIEAGVEKTGKVLGMQFVSLTCAEATSSPEQGSGLPEPCVWLLGRAVRAARRKEMNQRRFSLAVVEVTCLREDAGRGAHLRVPAEPTACFCATGFPWLLSHGFQKISLGFETQRLRLRIRPLQPMPPLQICGM